MVGKFILKEELETFAHSVGFSLVKGIVDIDSEKSNQIELPEQKDFFEFQQHVENKLLFYSYGYEHEEDYLIPDEYHQAYDGALQKEISQKINDYNRKIKEIDFDIPATLLIYYLKDGFLFYHFNEREQVSELIGYEDMVDLIYEEVIEGIPKEQVREINQKLKVDEQKRELEIKEEIFSDSEFKKATNANLRTTYSLRFFREKPEYVEFLRKIGYFHPTAFIEHIWREFKEKGLHK